MLETPEAKSYINMAQNAKKIEVYVEDEPMFNI